MPLQYSFHRQVARNCGVCCVWWELERDAAMVWNYVRILYVFCVFV